MIVFDCEIKQAIPEKNRENLEGIKYCKSWRDFPNMGIAVVCVYDFREQRYRVFCEDTLSDFQDLVNDRSIIIGFNNRAFDNRLCEANGIIVPASKSYDILVEVWAAAGLSPEYQHPSHAGFGLEALCGVNFGLKKSGKGAHAPVLWQQGKIGAVIDYCLDDVRLTRLLLERIMLWGVIRDPRDPDKTLYVKWFMK